jgi:hypothetical protein
LSGWSSEVGSGEKRRTGSAPTKIHRNVGIRPFGYSVLPTSRTGTRTTRKPLPTSLGGLSSRPRVRLCPSAPSPSNTPLPLCLSHALPRPPPPPGPGIYKSRHYYKRSRSAINHPQASLRLWPTKERAAQPPGPPTAGRCTAVIRKEREQRVLDPQQARVQGVEGGDSEMDGVTRTLMSALSSS